MGGANKSSIDVDTAKKSDVFQTPADEVLQQQIHATHNHQQQSSGEQDFYNQQNIGAGKLIDDSIDEFDPDGVKRNLFDNSLSGSNMKNMSNTMGSGGAGGYRAGGGNQNGGYNN